MNWLIPLALCALALSSPTDTALAALESVGAFVVHGVGVATDAMQVAMSRPVADVAPAACGHYPIFEASGRVVGVELAGDCAIH